MRRTTRSRRRRSVTKGRLILFLSGGLMTAALLVVTLISLEERSPIQGAPAESPVEKPAAPTAELPADPSPRPSGKESPTPVLPETFTFYETLPEPDQLDPGFVDLTPERDDPLAVKPATLLEPVDVAKKNVPAGYTVQVAANRDQSPSTVLSERLKQKGYHAFIVRHDSPERGTWYRVRVGHFKDRKAAAEMAGRLSRREQLETFIAFETEAHKP